MDSYAFGTFTTFSPMLRWTYYLIKGGDQMKKVNRIPVLLLTLVLAFTLTACGQPTQSAPASTVEHSVTASTIPEAVPSVTEATAPEASSTTESSLEESSVAEPAAPEIVIEYPLFDETQTYSIWMGTAPDLTEVVKEMDQFVIFRELEKVTNVTWNATMVSFMAEAEQFQLMVAGGDYTDVVCKAVDNYSGTVDQAIDDDFLIDLAPYVEENMPNLAQWFHQYPELRKQITSNAGAIGAFPKIYAAPSDISSGGMIRADWLADLGLKEPKTFDDLYHILNEFRDKKGATSPLVIAMPSGVQAELLSGYNIAVGYYQVDGEVRYGAIQPEFRDYLSMMNKWYTEGLIDDLFLSNQYESLVDMSPILNGTCGVWYGTAAQAITYIIGSATDPNMRITGVTNITTDGSMAHVGESGSMFDSHLWSVTTVCKDPEVICRYIDYVYSEDGILLANYGVEGETFNYNTDGTPVLTDLVLNNPDYSYGAAMNIFVCDRMTPVPFVIDEARVRANYVEDQINAINVWNNSNDGLYNMPKVGVNLTVDESSAYNARYSDIETYMDENIVKFIVGDKPLDEFDAYVDTLIQMGVEDCVAIQQAAYDRYLAN